MARSFARRFEAAFPRALAGPRKIGREAEFPVVWPDGSAADVRLLLRELKNQDRTLQARHEGGFDRLLSSQDTTQLVGMIGRDAEYSLEVGWGTVEVITGPYDDLHQLRAAHEAAMDPLLAAASRLGMSVLGYGIQPRTPPSRELMSPRARYGLVLEAVGDPWLSFTVTASDQVHVDVARGEIMAVNDLAGLLTPLVVALCANSPVHSGKPSGFASAREGLMGHVQSSVGRHGMPRGDHGTVERFVEHLMELPFLMAPDETTGVWARLPEQRPFREWLEACGGSAESHWPSFLAHEHYVWHSCRPRSKQRTVELRAACQQPGDSHMASSALSLGIVEAAPQLNALVTRWFGGDRDAAWTEMRAWHRQAVAGGLAPTSGADPDPLSTRICDAAAKGDAATLVRLMETHALADSLLGATDLALAAARGDTTRVRHLVGEPPAFDVAGFVEEALTVMRQALEGRGLGEEEYLEPLLQRAQRREAPAQAAQAAAEAGGLAALLEAVRLS